MDTLKAWLRARLAEKTTWAGLLGLLATALGVTFAPEQVAALANVVALAISGAPLDSPEVIGSGVTAAVSIVLVLIKSKKKAE